MAQKNLNPLAQTFNVDSEKFPAGFFLHSVDLWFSSSIDIDDIEYFWNSIIKEKKSGHEYLVKTLVQKNKKNNLELQIWDEQNDELQISDIKSVNPHFIIICSPTKLHFDQLFKITEFDIINGYAN